MSMPALRLFLVRHGEAAANVEMRYLGHRDDPLSEHGIKQATQISRALAPLPIDAIITSPLRRAADTAAMIAEAHQVPVQMDERLREGGFGSWEGLSRAEVLARSPQDKLLLVDWEADPGAAPPGGESLQVVQARVLMLVQEAVTKYAGQWIVLVSHVGPIKALLCAAMQVPLSTTRHLFLDPATISVVDWSNQPVIRLFNAHGHLGWEAARWMGRRLSGDLPAA
jgi:ribonuclease H / adenosylcobalamin/alpha-ribazole phosphatase